MPIYEFNCPECKTNFEELVFGNTLPPCPKCGSDKTKKLLSCAVLHNAEPSRAGQTVTLPSAPTGGGCAGCSGGNCSSCG